MIKNNDIFYTSYRLELGLPEFKKRLWNGLVVTGESLFGVILTDDGGVLALLLLLILFVFMLLFVVFPPPTPCVLDRYFCLTSSVVKVAPVLRSPVPAELSEPVLDSEEAPRPVGVKVSVDVLLQYKNMRMILFLLDIPFFSVIFLDR